MNTILDLTLIRMKQQAIFLAFQYADNTISDYEAEQFLLELKVLSKKIRKQERVHG